jgi:hypothetical protein
MPLKPRINPVQVSLFDLPRVDWVFGQPKGRRASINAIQRGAEPTSKAAIPEVMNCSDQVRPPLPPINKSKATTPAPRHSIRFGRGSPLVRLQMYKTPPAIRKREPAIKKGGTVSTAKRIAR